MRGKSGTHDTAPGGEAIRSTIDWIGRQLGRGPSKLAAAKWPTTPQIGLPDSREALIRHLEDDDAFTLGDLIALVSLT